MVKRASTRGGKKLTFNQVKQVQKIVNKNKQYREHFIYISTESNSTGYLGELTNVQYNLASDYNDRVGNTLQVKHIEVKLDYLKADTVGQLNRILIVRSKVGPLISTDFPVVNAQANLSRMEILYDKMFYERSGAATGGVEPVVNFKHSFKSSKVPHLNVEFVDEDSTTAAQKNPIYIWIISETAAASTDNLVTGYSKLHYYDKGQ